MRIETFQKIALYILSMSFFFIVVGFLCMDIPMYFGEDAEFIGWSELYTRNKLCLFIIVITIISEWVTYRYLKWLWNRTGKELSVKIRCVEETNYDTLTFIASFTIPLVSFNFDKLNHWFVLVLFWVAIGVIFCHSKGYYMNPTLVLLKFHLYKVVIVPQGEKNEKIMVLISRKPLSADQRTRYAKITDEVGYVM